jgi:hypothetical protein
LERGDLLQMLFKQSLCSIDIVENCRLPLKDPIAKFFEHSQLWIEARFSDHESVYLAIVEMGKLEFEPLIVSIQKLCG